MLATSIFWKPSNHRYLLLPSFRMRYSAPCRLADAHLHTTFHPSEQEMAPSCCLWYCCLFNVCLFLALMRRLSFFPVVLALLIWWLSSNHQGLRISLVCSSCPALRLRLRASRAIISDRFFWCHVNVASVSVQK